jgi:predicted transport protein
MGRRSANMNKGYTQYERLTLKGNGEYNEKWVQQIISDDPKILGLGELVLRTSEKIQPHAGRLDLLLQDPETLRRYEVELQLGPTDESHIIRTIEYWDIERTRYPQYDHCAVLIAEDITSRFLNVVSLFNGTIPLVAIQMRAIKFDDHVFLIFTTVMDEFSRGYVDEDEDAESAPTDRAYWEKRGSKKTVALADQMLTILHEFDPTLELKYNKYYIGLSRDKQAFNFVSFRPQKSQFRLQLKLPQTEDIDAKIAESGLVMVGYSHRSGQYAVQLTQEDILSKEGVLKELARAAYAQKSAL